MRRCDPNRKEKRVGNAIYMSLDPTRSSFARSSGLQQGSRDEGNKCQSERQRPKGISPSAEHQVTPDFIGRYFMLPQSLTTSVSALLLLMCLLDSIWRMRHSVACIALLDIASFRRTGVAL